MKAVLLKNIEAEYQRELKTILDNGKKLKADTLIELSIKLHQNVKATGVPTRIHEYDMLLFQYGTYDYDNLGKHFIFDITRQFAKEDPDSLIHQLSLTLIFDPTNFSSLEESNFWSMDFENLDEFAHAIKNTDAYKLVKETPYKEHRLTFEQC